MRCEQGRTCEVRAEDDATVAAAIAHSWKNALLAMSGSAYLLSREARGLDETTREALRSAVEANAAMLGDRFHMIAGNCSDEFADAATIVGIAARSLREVPVEGAVPLLDIVVEHSKLLAAELHTVVRRLPRDVLLALAELGSPT